MKYIEIPSRSNCGLFIYYHRIYYNTTVKRKWNKKH